MSEPVLSVERLTKVFQLRRAAAADARLVAVDGVSFSLEPGGSIAVVGESGSGKSTLARMICGLETPTAGEVLFHGRPRLAHGRDARRQVAKQVQMVFQDPYSSLDPRQTGREALDEVLKVHTEKSARERDETVTALGDQVGLGPNELAAPPRKLSGGQRQRLAIARALAVDPEILIFDEAVSALDVSVQAQILNLLVEIRRARRLSFVFVSHDLAVVRQISESIIVMRKGRIVESGLTAAVLSDPQAPYTRVLRESVPRRGWRPQRSLAHSDEGDGA